ncbi:hypothetical protein Taro_048707, partial [Colocasia esculenta]|nr:hypothetical protein [Colocasia esculenta]
SKLTLSSSSSVLELSKESSHLAAKIFQPLDNLALDVQAAYIYSMWFNGCLLESTSHLEWRKLFQLVRNSKDARSRSKMLTMCRGGIADIKCKTDDQTREGRRQPTSFTVSEANLLEQTLAWFHHQTQAGLLLFLDKKATHCFTSARKLGHVRSKCPEILKKAPPRWTKNKQKAMVGTWSEVEDDEEEESSKAEDTQ